VFLEIDYKVNKDKMDLI